MGEAIGQILPLAVAVALNPVAIAVVVLMLVSVRGRANGPAFVLGWIVGVALVGAILLAVTRGSAAGDDGEPATWVDWLKVVLGALLLFLALRLWRARPGSDDVVPTPGWMGAIDSFSPVKAMGVGLALSVVNPKNLLFIIGAAATEAETSISGGQETFVWAIFTVIATAGVAAPVVVYFAMGDRAPEVLDRLKTWMIRNGSVVVAVLCLVIGTMLVGDAISGFFSG